mmetsp:Transcript_8234/g.30554  ORF Transcript_8234/g.30554 Transcript_8234/m.30554 type:complete len:203 (+) Transcript_8234:1146-1754(+)
MVRTNERCCNLQAKQCDREQNIKSQTTRTELHSLDEALDVVEHVTLGAVTVDVFDNIGILAHDGINVAVVHRQAVRRLFFRVVASLRQSRGNFRRRRREERHVINSSVNRIQASADDAVNENFIRHIEQQEQIRLDSTLLQRLCLLFTARVAIQQPTLGAIRLRQAVLDHGDDDFVWHQVAAIHELLRLLTSRSAFGHSRSQ